MSTMFSEDNNDFGKFTVFQGGNSSQFKDIDDIMIGLVDRHYLDRINLKIDFKPLEKLLLGIKVEKKEEVKLL